MTNIKNLTSIYLKQAFANFAVNKSKSNGKNNLVYKIILAVVIVSYVFFVLFINYRNSAQALSEVNNQNYILLMGFVNFSLVLLFFSAYEIQGYFLKRKDFNLLSSLPIKTHEIVISRLIYVIIYSYLYEFLLILPTLAVWFIYSTISFISVLYVIIGLLLLPMFTLLLSVVFTFFFSQLVSKLKNYNLANIIYYFVLLAGILFVVYYTSFELMNVFMGSENVPVILYIFSPNGVILFHAVHEKSFLWLLLFIVISLFCLGAMFVIIHSLYKKINQSLNNAKVVKKKGALIYHQNSHFKTLLKEEIKKYFSIPIYVFNTIFGMFLLVGASIAGVVIYIAQKPIVEMLTKVDVYTIVLSMFCIMCALSLTTNSSISLEGSKFYLKRVMPFSFQNIALSKIALNLVVTLPLLLLGWLIILPVLVVMGLHVLQIISLILMPAAVLVCFSTISFMVNLWFPKLVWNNETEVVKQSFSVFLTTFLGFIIFGVFSVLYSFVFSSFLSFNWFVVICFAVIVCLFVLFVYLIKTTGKKLYYSIG